MTIDDIIRLMRLGADVKISARHMTYLDLMRLAHQADELQHNLLLTDLHEFYADELAAIANNGNGRVMLDLGAPAQPHSNLDGETVASRVPNQPQTMEEYFADHPNIPPFWNE